VVGLMRVVFNGRVDILSFEERIIGQNFVEASTISKKLKNAADSNTIAAYAGRPPHLPSSTVIRLSLSALIFNSRLHFKVRLYIGSGTSRPHQECSCPNAHRACSATRSFSKAANFSNGSRNFA
jgi:hypothetical protein